MFKKIFFSFLFLSIFLLPSVALAEDTPLDTLAAEQGPVISMFMRDDCRHCKDAEAFLEDFLVERPDVRVVYYNLDEQANKDNFDAVTTQYDMVKGTPVTLINGVLIQGFGTAETTGEVFRELVDRDLHTVTFDDVVNGEAVEVFNGTTETEVCTEEGCDVSEKISYKITIPIIGTVVDVGGFSLSALSLILGLVDGFNPCAMWVLVMFLFVLSQAGSRKRMFQYAGLFIVAEAVMYYLILNVWFTAWDFIELNKYVTPGVGLLALGSGIYFIYKFYTYSPVCKVASIDQQKKMSDKVKELAKKPLTLGVAFGILALAFSVNIFEFACSIGIPQTYTKILELNFLTFWETQWYMFLYIIMYMFDDIIVFGIGIYALEKISMVHKYSKWSTLVGGILMLLLGFVMLFNPEFLVF
ncbi:MAG: glutaredoxin [Candidatus Magasanikbacteria bacterium]|nr:glutaredoxin [Candidatus Magasanikbacteria bacterium]